MAGRQEASNRKAIPAFCLYDVGNSAFATVILAVLYNQYFAEEVAFGSAGVRILGRPVPGATLYSWLVAATMFFVALSGPVLGAWADAGGNRRAWLRGLTLLGVAATLGLATVGPGDWIHGSILFMLAYGAFAAASIFYNSILPSLGPPERLGRISGLAWGFGFLGGGVVLVLSLWLVAAPGRFGLNANGALRAAFALSGLWWGVFSLPMILERDARGEFHGTEANLISGFRQARVTLHSLLRCRHFRRFLIAYFLYNDGVQTVVVTASIFAASELGFAPRQLILLFLMIQATGFLGSIVSGRIADRTSHRTTILVQVAGWVGITLWAYRVGWLGDATREFWILGGLAGLLLGGVQTVSRSLLARWVPADRSAEIFGFFAVAGRFASVGGPLLFGALAWATGGLRPAVLSISLFFLTGGAFLLAVDERRGEVELREVGESSGSGAPE